MRTFLFAALFVLYFLTVYAQNEVHKFSKNLTLAWAIAPETKQLIWIFFTDKGLSTNLSENADNSFVTDRSLQRRKKVLPENALFDFTDLPVFQGYVQQLESFGIQIKQISRWFNGVSCYASQSQISQLAQLTFVRSFDLVQKYKKRAESFSPNKINPSTIIDYSLPANTYDYGPSLTQLQMMHIPELHNLGYTGQGVIIAVLDAGFNLLSHQCFSQMHIRAKYDFVNHDPGVGDSSDLGNGWHGTATLSSIGGFKPGSLIGPAFNAEYLLAKTENTYSETPIEEDNWIAGIEWADSLGADISSTSLGYLDFDPPYTSYTWESMDGNTCRITIAADLAVKKGIAVFNSAGNEGWNPTRNTLNAPADGDSVITIGAVGSDGFRSNFSSVGNTVDGRTKPDLMAMGSNVYTASPYDTTQYMPSNGTSFSCPLAAGAAAVILSARPSLTPMQLRESLRNTASNSSSPNREYGWGIINALNAMYYYPIPVQFLNFSSSIQGKKVHLQWKTASEKNDSGFEVQRSLDQKGWVKVSFVRGAGTSTVTNSYSLDDIPGKLDKYYYRLKQIDFDGTFIYSNTISVDLTKNIDLSLSQNYPNPFNPETEISYTLPASGQVALQLYSTAGEKIREIFSGYQEKGEYSLRMALTDLASGIYFYQLIFTDQLYNTTTTLTKKLVLLR